jgi:CheY-like chemotaxis protein
MTTLLSINLASQTLPLNGVWLPLVEDQADTAELIRLVLEDAGAEVIAVRSAYEALKAVECFIPTVLISDIHLPDLDGYALLRRIKEQLQSSQLYPSPVIPALALTGYSSPFLDKKSRQRATAAGFQQYLSKPVEIDELVRVVAQLSQSNPSQGLLS